MKNVKKMRHLSMKVKNSIYLLAFDKKTSKHIILPSSKD